jgi:hypothetical protein
MKKNHIDLTTLKLYFMTLQQLTIPAISNIAWLKRSAVKMICLVVAGFLFTALLYNRSSNGSTPQSNMPAAAQPSTGAGSSSRDKDTQCTEATRFSLMPGRLNRFLQ